MASRPFGRTLADLIRLVRFPEFAHFVLLTTLIAARLAGARLDWRLPAVLLVNLLSVASGFVVNEVEDAPVDALHPSKRRRNPIASDRLSRQTGLTMAAALAVLSLVLCAFLGPLPFAINAISLGIGWAYSWRSIRLKAILVVDLLVHGWELAGLQFVLTYVALGGSAWAAVWPVMAAMMLVSMYGQFYNELHDLETDRRAGIYTTAVAIGPRLSRGLMYILLAGGIGLFALACWQGVMPWWLLAAPLLMVCLLLLWRWLMAWFSLSQWLPVLVAFPHGNRVRDARGQQALDVTGSLQIPALIGLNIIVIIWFLLGL